MGLRIARLVLDDGMHGVHAEALRQKAKGHRAVRVKSLHGGIDHRAVQGDPGADGKGRLAVPCLHLPGDGPLVRHGIGRAQRQIAVQDGRFLSLLPDLQRCLLSNLLDGLGLQGDFVHGFLGFKLHRDRGLFGHKLDHLKLRLLQPLHDDNIFIRQRGNGQAHQRRQQNTQKTPHGLPSLSAKSDSFASTLYHIMTKSK